jgi:hypothetical protein
VSRLRIAAAAAAVAVACSSCVGLPTSGPVVEAEAPPRDDEAQASVIDAQPPIEDATPVQIVSGFLDAMTAWPIETSVAKQFLTRDAAAEWKPEAGTIVYGNYGAAQTDGSDVRLTLSDADRLDASGAWQGQLSGIERSLEVELVLEDGQYRIANPVNALAVPDTWFQQRFRQVSLYFFDPSTQILVPEPVFVPIGSQLATSLVSSLVTGPPAGLEEVVATFVPRGLSVGLSVPVSDDGVAQVNLVGDGRPPAPEEADLMYAQLAWTLQQDPDITAVRVTIGGEELLPTSGSTPYDFDLADRYDPAGPTSTNLLFGVRRGVLLRGGIDSLEPAEGPFGQQSYDLRSVAVRPDESRAAGVVADGTRLLVGPVQESGPVETEVPGAVDLAQPSWDLAGRLWLLDRTPAGARVFTIDRRGLREIDVPGVSSRDAQRLIVSRDGTRLVAIVRSPTGDQVVGARVVLGGDGRVLRAVAPSVVRAGEPRGQVLDLAWAPPLGDVPWARRVDLALLTPARTTGLYEVETIPVTGGFLAGAQPSSILRGRALGVAGTPSPDRRLLAVLDDQVIDVRTREAEPLPGRVRGLDYAG